ncbi:MAG: hypothetical protein ACLSB9_17455 [Hydrogeniiclostridium mannosilyticum]
MTAAGYNLAKWLVEDVLLHKDAPLTIASNEVLWSIIPKDIIFRYVRDGQLKQKARELIRSGKYVQSMRYKPDFTLKRRLHFTLNQMNYRKIQAMLRQQGTALIAL